MALHNSAVGPGLTIGDFEIPRTHSTAPPLSAPHSNAPPLSAPHSNAPPLSAPHSNALPLSAPPLSVTEYADGFNASRVPASWASHLGSSGLRNLRISNLNESLYVTSLSHTLIDESIDILKEYKRLKGRLNIRYGIGYLKKAVEKIEKEIIRLSEMMAKGGSRRNRTRTHKKAMRRNKTRARK